MNLLTEFGIKDKINKFKNSKYIKKILNFTSSHAYINFMAKSIASAIILIISSIPTMIYILVRFLIEPVGFWQEFALFVVACIAIGWLQVGLWLVAGILIIAIIADRSV